MTCEMVSDTLGRFPRADWDPDDRQCLAEYLQGFVDWNSFPLVEHIVQHETSLILFATDENVLTYDDTHGLRIRTWADVETELAPQLEADRKRDETEQHKAETRTILRSELPPRRKLKAMQDRIVRLSVLWSLTGEKISDEGQRAIDYILAMKADDPTYAECGTFADYVQRVAETQRAAQAQAEPELVPATTEPPEPQPEPAPPTDARTDNVVPFRPNSAPNPKSRTTKTSTAPAAPAQPTQIDRDAILQDAAKLVTTRISVLRVRGSADGLQIKGLSDNRRLFVEANWPPHPDIQDNFLLEILTRHEGRILTREQPGETALVEGFKISYDNISWETITTPFAEVKSQFVAAIKIAKADRHEEISVIVNDGSVKFDEPSEIRFWRRDLEWLWRKNVTAIRYSEQGVIGATVTGIAGDYIVTLRGTEA